MAIPSSFQPTHGRPTRSARSEACRDPRHQVNVFHHRRLGCVVYCSFRVSHACPLRRSMPAGRGRARWIIQRRSRVRRVDLGLTSNERRRGANLQLHPVVASAGTGPAPNGSATVSWVPPTTNSDGSALTNLAGYQIDYGTSSGALTKTVKVTNPGTSRYTVTNLPSGTWYFAVQAYTNSGVQSALSNVSSKVIP
jgi:hypothetical protein